MVPAAVLALGGGCSSILDVDPTRYVAEDVAIVDGASARAALAGAYDALQSVNYYAEPIISLAELASDNMEWTGTFTSYRQFDRNQLLTTNSQVEATWNDIYEGINRANVVIQKVPEVAPISDEEKNRIVGEALFLRALHYHNLVKFWGGVPIRTEPFASIDDASQITRATVAEVYTQILADLQRPAGETLIARVPVQPDHATLDRTPLETLVVDHCLPERPEADVAAFVFFARRLFVQAASGSGWRWGGRSCGRRRRF
jgi:starch-binding outer membrane protein, SusD/RagB family